MSPAPVLEFLKRHWPKFLAVALIVLAFFLGWVSKPVGPERVVEKEVLKEKLVDHEVKVEVARELTAEEMQRIRDEVRHEVRRTEVHEVQHPDGTKTRDEVSTTGIDTTTKEQEVKIVEKVVEQRVYVDRVVEKEVLKTVEKVTDAPERLWAVSALVSVDPTQFRVVPALVLPVQVGALVQLTPTLKAGPLRLPLTVGLLGSVGVTDTTNLRGTIGLTAGVRF